MRVEGPVNPEAQRKRRSRSPLGRQWHRHLCQVEHVGCDPKDGELCLGKVKPVETLVEACSDSDVQIDRVTWV